MVEHNISREKSLRIEALRLAEHFIGNSGVMSAGQPDKVVEAAEKFYTFLKG